MEAGESSLSPALHVITFMSRNSKLVTLAVLTGRLVASLEGRLPR